MPGKRTAGRFRESEIARSVKAVIKGGGTVKRVILADPVIIECGEQGTEPHSSTEVNEWDQDLYGKDTPPVRK